jgi:hypothetical protein
LLLDPSDEVDAVAYDDVRKRLLFSTKRPADDPIMFYHVISMFGPVPYMASTMAGDTVSRRAGLLRGDDVDAICALDPGSNQRLQRLCAGRPDQRLLPFPAQVNASAFRVLDPTRDVLTACLVGWPPSGQGPGFAVPFVSLPQNPLGLVDLGLARVRNPNPRWPGDPLTVPIGLPHDHSLYGQQILLHWAAANATLTSIDVSLPLRFTL